MPHLRKGQSIEEYNRILATHLWVSRQKNKTGICSDCGDRTSPTQWSNVDHQYRRVIEDYIEKCESCHKRSDYKETACINGHEWTEDNIYVRPDNGRRGCKICRSEKSRLYYEKSKVAHAAS